MGRLIGGVVAGYLLIFVLVFVSFSLGYLVVGVDGAFQPGTYDVSALWILISFALGFGAAVAGGVVCAAIARTPTGPRSLAVVVLVLGFLLAIPVVLGASEAPAVREASVGALAAMQNARQPVWIALLNPIVGAVGVLLGGGLRRPRPAA